MTPPAATATTPTTLSRATPLRRPRERRGYPRPLQRQSDGEVYAGIARAWWQMHRAGEHHQHPMRTFVVRQGFAEEVWGRPDVDPHDVLAVCARLVTMEDFRIRETATITRRCEGLTEGLDPIHGFWLALTNTPELGIHFWHLVLVPVELRRIGPVDDPPSLEHGRFAQGRLRAVPARR
jgi:hypothetical protein